MGPRRFATQAEVQPIHYLPQFVASSLFMTARNGAHHSVSFLCFLKLHLWPQKYEVCTSFLFAKNRDCG